MLLRRNRYGNVENLILLSMKEICRNILSVFKEYSVIKVGSSLGASELFAYVTVYAKEDVIDAILELCKARYLSIVKSDDDRVSEVVLEEKGLGYLQKL